MRASWLLNTAVSIGVMVACSACSAQAGSRIISEANMTTGSGKEIREERMVSSAFTGVESAFPFTTIVTAGKPQRVVIIGDDNVVPKVKVEPYGRVLKISMPGVGFYNNAKCRAEIEVPQLTSAAGSGSGSLELRDVDAKDFELSLDGSGNVTISGATKNLELIVSGSGNADASGLKCKAASVLLQGSGNAKVAPKKEFHAALTGSGNIVCIGKPETVEEAVKGSGVIQYK